MASQTEEPFSAAADSGSFYHVTLTLKPFRLEPVLLALAPFHLLSLVASEIRGYGRQKGHLELYRGSEYVISFIPKVKLEFVVFGSELEEACRAVQGAARTGRIGDGKVFIQRLEGLHTEEPLPID
jgi:nitrogen regulatory protein P-II 2